MPRFRKRLCPGTDSEEQRSETGFFPELGIGFGGGTGLKEDVFTALGHIFCHGNGSEEE